MKQFLSLIILLISSHFSFSQITSQLTESQREEISAKAFQMSTYVTKLKNTEMKRTQKYFLDSVHDKRINPQLIESNFKSFFQYDLIGRNTQGEDFKWDPNISSWTSLISTETDFGSMNTVSVYFSSYSQYFFRIDYIYDNLNSLLKIKLYEYITQSDFWFNYEIQDLTYNGPKLISKFYYSRDQNDTSIVNLESKIINTYSSDLLTNISYYEFFNNTDSLMNSHNIYYNSDDLVEKTEVYDHNPNNGQFEIDYSYIFEYNLSNKINKKIGIFEQTISGQADTISIIDYSYDFNGNLASLIWKNGYTAEVEEERTFYYDENISLNEVVLPVLYFPFEGGFEYYSTSQYPLSLHRGNMDEIDYFDLFKIVNANKLDSSFVLYNNVNNVLSQSSHYYYSQREVGFDEINKENLKLYPNPTNDFLNIENASNFKEFSIYNSLGVLEKNEVLKSDKIDVSKLKSGVYFIKLVTKEGSGDYYKFIIE